MRGLMFVRVRPAPTLAGLAGQLTSDEASPVRVPAEHAFLQEGVCDPLHLLWPRRATGQALEEGRSAGRAFESPDTGCERFQNVRRWVSPKLVEQDVLQEPVKTWW